MRRPLNDRMIAGVCSAIGNETGVDTRLIRLAFLAAFLLFGAGPLLYIILWILIKPEGV